MFCNLLSALRLQLAYFHVIICSSPHLKNGCTCPSFKTSEQFQGAFRCAHPRKGSRRGEETRGRRVTTGECDGAAGGLLGRQGGVHSEWPACLPSALLLGPLKKRACLSFLLLPAKSQHSASSLLTPQSLAQTLKFPQVISVTP